MEQSEYIQLAALGRCRY